MPTRTAITVVRGDYKEFNITLQEYINGTATAISLSGCKVYFTVRPNYGETAVLEYDSDDSDEIEIVTPASGIIKLKINGDDTINLTPKTFLFDIQVETADLDRITCNIGEITIQPDITT